MQYSRSLCLFLGLQTAMAAAVDRTQSPSDDGIEGYRTEPMVWEVPVFPDGEKATITGTVEEVHVELLRRNPQWDTDFLEVAVADDDSLKPPKDSFSDRHAICGPGKFNGLPAETKYIADGIAHLRGLKGQPYQAPGRGGCSRVSCSGDSAIWFCNDDANHDMTDKYSAIADGAARIMDECERRYCKSNTDGETAPCTYTAVGQIFHPHKAYNVIVRHDQC